MTCYENEINGNLSLCWGLFRGDVARKLWKMLINV